MPFKIDIFILVIFIALINQNYAAIFQDIQRDDSEGVSDYYLRMRSRSVHRGALLAMSSKERKETCIEILSSLTIQYEGDLGDTLEPILGSSMGQTREDESGNAIFVGPITSKGGKNIVDEEILFACRGKKVAKENTETQSEPVSYTFLISFAFDTNVFKVSQKKEDPIFIDASVWEDYNVSLSPEFGSKDKNETKELYQRIRQNIEALRKESPELVEMIEKNNDIEALSDEERSIICGSILTSPYFESRNLEVDATWFKSETKKGDIFDQSISFMNEDNTSGELYLRVVLCKALDTVTEKIHDFLYTPSYSNENSVFLLEMLNSKLEFDSYIKHIPMLIEYSKKRSESIHHFV